MTSRSAPPFTPHRAVTLGTCPMITLSTWTASASRPRSPRQKTTIAAAELYAIGTWERVDGGYRVLDWEAVEYALDGVRQRTGEAPKAMAADRDHEARAWAYRATPMVVTPPCAVCGTLSARVELVAPGHVPAEWQQWPATVQASMVRQRQPGQWYLLFKGVATYNGYGDPIDASRAGRIARAFRPPLRFAQVHTAGFYDDAGFCQDCDAPYCYRHWHVTESGYGYCPHGHGKSLALTFHRGMWAGGRA
jgi:hypothetical protein